MRKALILTLILSLGIAAKAVPAFPGAEGAAKYATGGRGGEVKIVTSLADSMSEGTLRRAIVSASPRIIVFNVSGTIELTSGLTIGATLPNVTIAGQSAPGDGICIANYPLTISADNVIIRYLRFRSGDTAHDDHDSVHISNTANNVMIDHCSTSWGTDEVLSTPQSPDVGDFTVQWCIISEGLNKSAHTEGAHSKGSLLYGGKGSVYSFHHNIYAHNADRNPRIASWLEAIDDPNGIYLDWRNNVIYNWGGNYAGLGRSGSERVHHVNFVNNYYKQGASSTGTFAFDETSVISEGYFAGNMMNGSDPCDAWSLVNFVGFTEPQKTAYKQGTDIPMPSVTTTDAETAYQQVLADAGASLPKRDGIDTRIVDSIINGTGDFVDCVEGTDYYDPTDATAIGGGPNTIVIDDPSGNFAREKGQVGYDIEIISGTGAGQTRLITYFHDITNEDPDKTQWYRVDPNWTTIPDATSHFRILIDCTVNAGGWPIHSSTTPPTDTDNDGIPDFWETAEGLNPNDANDSNDIAVSGYSYIEEYLNYLVEKDANFPADLNNDEVVDNNDLDLLTDDWLDDACGQYSLNNLNLDCDVDMLDFSEFAIDWLETY